MYIDAYDWVMVPNTYGMTQFADGGLMMTKPYISGSNYLLKMGDWKKAIGKIPGMACFGVSFMYTAISFHKTRVWACW
ncbi:hypothetical protein ACRQ5D_11885 [Mucilaginibacter sp. P25]|uniref:hypothetical protein n=1 Tax=Mucilaginibacter sp. P25 TaxID=3423945 RepID=UPI003D7BB897